MRVVVDLRARERYAEGHLEGAFSFPFGSLKSESCGLPPRETALTAIVDEGVDREAAEEYLRRLRFADLEVRPLRLGEQLVREVPAGLCWAPSPFLAEVVEAIEGAGGGPSFALDVGAGAGRDMVFLALRGWAAVGVENRRRLVDDGCALARRHGVGGLVAYICCSVRKRYPVREGSVDLLHASRFLHRPSLPELLRLPRRGGHLVYSHFLEGCQRTAVGHPSSEAGFFHRGELRQMLEEAGFAVLREREGTLPDKRPFFDILARRL